MVFIGAHISREKTLQETIDRIIDNDGNALQIFASNPRSSKITDLNESFFGKDFHNKKGFALVIHNPYVINLAMPFMNNKRTIEIKDAYWIKLVLHELEIAHLIGSVGCIVHCGKYTNQMPIDGIKNMKLALDFIINEIDPSLYAFDYFNFMLHGQPASLRNKYKDQKGFILEQEILFNRLTKFTKITFLGAITAVNDDCLSAANLQDGEISLCLDGCLYNNKGKLSCSINILGENGLQDIKFFYGPQKYDLELHMSMAVASVNDILGIKIYTCKLEPFDSVAVPSTSIIIDDTTLRLKLLTTGQKRYFP